MRAVLRLRSMATVILAGLLGLGLAGAARSGDGGLLQGPGTPVLWGGLLLLAAVLAAAVRDGGPLRALRGLWPVPAAVLLLGAGWAGAGAWTGPPLVALGLAGAATLIASARPRFPAWAFVPAAFALHLAVGAHSAVRVGPQGDEPHYLVVADSLLRDHDLRLERDFEERRYLAFFDRPMEPHYRVRGKGGAIYSLHAVGLSVLILPAWALAGYPGVVAFMALLTALLCNEVRLLLRRVLSDPVRADLLAAVFAFCPPLLPFGGLVFTEVPAALAVAFVLRLGLDGRGGVGRGVAIGLALGVLPWLNARYSILSVLLALYVVAGRPGPRVWLPGGLVAALSASGIALYHSILYGFFDPRRVYGRRPEFAPETLFEGAPGLLLDQEFGLLVYAPVFALTLPGLWSLRRTRPRLAWGAAAALGAMFLVAGSWHMWRGGFNPPARFLVPLWAPLVLGAAWTVRSAVSSRAALLLGWTLFVALAGAARPELVHRDRDGTAPLWRASSGAEEWTGLLPAYVLGEPDRHSLAALWGGVLLLAALGRHRPATARGFLAATLVLLAATSGAARLSDAAGTARDHVRLLGRPALALPAGRFEPSTSASWVPAPADYAPHRSPHGFPIADRIDLAAGVYRLDLALGDRPPGTESPRLRWVPERPGAQPVIAADAELRYRFEVLRGGPGQLALVAGGPARVTGVQLHAEPTFSVSRGPSGQEEEER